MNNGAFYFQKDSLLLPAGIVSPETEMELPLDHAAGFPASDIFTIPAIVGSDTSKGGGVTGGPAGSALSEAAPPGTISCVSIPPEVSLPPAWQAIPVRQILSLLPEGNFDPLESRRSLPDGVTEKTGQSARMLRAFHIAQWRRESLFCGSCGSKNTDSPDELARLCPACGRLEFPRIAPAVITLILNDEGKALLAHNKKFAPCLYSLIAGFAEAGESLEAAVVRETREEAGIEIRDIRYIVSQPWPFPSSLMVGFSARFASGTLKPDGVEIEDARWFARDNLPKLPGPGSVARYLINRWLAA